MCKPPLTFLSYLILGVDKCVLMWHSLLQYHPFLHLQGKGDNKAHPHDKRHRNPHFQEYQATFIITCQTLIHRFLSNSGSCCGLQWAQYCFTYWLFMVLYVAVTNFQTFEGNKLLLELQSQPFEKNERRNSVVQPSKLIFNIFSRCYKIHPFTLYPSFCTIHFFTQ